MSDSDGGIFHGSPFLFGSPTYWVTSLSRDPARFLVFLEGGDLVVTSGHRQCFVQKLRTRAKARETRNLRKKGGNFRYFSGVLVV